MYYDTSTMNFSYFPYFCQFVVSPIPIYMGSRSTPKPTERLRMRAWLETQLNTGSIPGFDWVDKEKGTFRIPWKHAARHGWDRDKDACLFMEWAIHTGKYSRESGENGNPKTWKANFRCALNSLPDIQEMPKMSNRKGSNAFKVYKFLPRKPTDRKRKGSQMKTRRSQTRTNDRASTYVKNNKHRSATTDNALRPRTRSMSRETDRLQENAQVKTEVQEKVDEYETHGLEIEPDERQWSVPATQPTADPSTYTQLHDAYPTPPQSASFMTPSTVSGFVPPYVPPVSRTVTVTNTPMTPIPSPISSLPIIPVPVKEEGRTDRDVNYNMSIDDDGGSSGSGSTPLTDDEVVDMVDEMTKDSGSDSPVNGFHNDEASWQNCQLVPTTTAFLPLTFASMQNHNSNTRCTALELTESWISQLDSQQDKPSNGELPILTDIPRPTFIKEPGDLDQYSEFASDNSPLELFQRIENLTE
ncbi:uncharacterized protein [Ptychodera flava]|uniref:uncharacterized protein isoform X2 n=1 Tax=Ptychodera flava TaxID=63121 RepID=UPI00396A03B7